MTFPEMVSKPKIDDKPHNDEIFQYGHLALGVGSWELRKRYQVQYRTVLQVY
jgi:hypothetical protein